jgi:microcystin degradation protein MlrC
MKVAIGGMFHETNTFNIRPTRLESFKTGYGIIASGKEILMHFSNTGTVLGGFIAAASEFNFDLVPTYYAQAGLDTGTIDQVAFDYLASNLTVLPSGKSTIFKYILSFEFNRSRSKASSILMLSPQADRYGRI